MGLDDAKKWYGRLGDDPITGYIDAIDAQNSVIQIYADMLPNAPLTQKLIVDMDGSESGSIGPKADNGGVLEISSSSQLWLSGLTVLNGPVVGYNYMALTDGWLGSEIVSFDKTSHSMGSKRVRNVATPTDNYDAANKDYVDTIGNTKVSKSGDTMGPLTVNGAVIVGGGDVPVTLDGNYGGLRVTRDPATFGNVSCADPTQYYHAATKNYVDKKTVSGQSLLSGMGAVEAGSTYVQQINFPQAFASAPIVVATVRNPFASAPGYYGPAHTSPFDRAMLTIGGASITAQGFRAHVHFPVACTPDGQLAVYYIAVGTPV